MQDSGNNYNDNIKWLFETTKDPVKEPFYPTPTGKKEESFISPLKPTETEKFSELKEKDYTKDLVKYEASAKSMVKQVNTVSKIINAYKIKVNEVEDLSNKYLKELQGAEEENEMLKEEGIKWSGVDRRRIRANIKKSRSDYNTLFQSTPTASSISQIKKLIEKEELPQYMEVLAGEAGRRGISINEYIEFMKTPEYDGFLDSKLNQLESRYKTKEKNLKSIVKRGSKK